MKVLPGKSTERLHDPYHSDDYIQDNPYGQHCIRLPRNSDSQYSSYSSNSIGSDPLHPHLEPLSHDHHPVCNHQCPPQTYRHSMYSEQFGHDRPCWHSHSDMYKPCTLPRNGTYPNRRCSKHDAHEAEELLMVPPPKHRTICENVKSQSIESFLREGNLRVHMPPVGHHTVRYQQQDVMPNHEQEAGPLVT